MKELTDIKGIGSKTIELYHKANIFTIDDLISYYPYRYEILERSNVNNLDNEQKIIIDGIVESIPQLVFFGKKRNKMTFRFNSNSFLCNVIIFNRTFLKSNLTIGKEITVIGKYDKLHNTIIASDIRLSPLPNYPVIEPVYHIIHGISNKKLNKTIIGQLDEFAVPDYIPDMYNHKYKFLSKKDSVINIHIPSNIGMLKSARKRLKYEELFLFMLKMNILKERKKSDIGLSRNVEWIKIEEVINKLPFELTSDQLKSIKEIYSDLIDTKRMNRLLQGDVGSGKTIVSFLSIIINYFSGYQSALMAPTEILAIQHYNNFNKLFKNLNINVEILTGKMQQKEKKRIYQDLCDGKIDVIIGTHALISDSVNYHNLGLVITDEQHRFGVNQRANLRNKGLLADILYMSATPIPRTYALTLYGDMDISSIKTMPNGRKEIKTIIKKTKEMKDVLTMMYQELESKHQIYVISPLIEESELTDLNNITILEEQMNKAFGKKYKIGVLHGKMSSIEKDNVMTSMKNNEIQILISTTVIEVGVDIPNTTMMVIFDAERFGLSTLHQLRGRVGRNDLQSYCILISNYEKERLNILTKTNDGFQISEEDFRLRGSGDLFGIKQSGDMTFKLADIKADYQMLLACQKDSLEFIKTGDYKKYVKVMQYLD